MRDGRRIRDNQIGFVLDSFQSGSEQHPAPRLFGFVLFEELAGFFEGEGVSIDDQLVFARVIGDGEDAFDTMAVLAEDLDDEIDVYHAWKSNSSRSWLRGACCTGF